MTYRGRLIFPFIANIARLDTSTTEDEDGYDHEFRTVKHRYPDGVRGERVSERRELPIVSLPCQVEVQQFGEQTMARSGNMPKTNMTLVLHFKDLEAQGLINDDQSPKLDVNARLVSLLNARTRRVAQTMGPNIYLVEAQVGGFGLGGQRNLILARFEDREQGRAASSGA